MRKLTEMERSALQSIRISQGKSGQYWRDLGVLPILISNLEAMGYVTAVDRAVGSNPIINLAWFITDAGRRALESRQND